MSRAPKQHPYIARKGITASAKYCRINKGRLALPMRDVETDDIISLQFIDADGGKKNSFQSRTKRGCFILGALSDDAPLVIVEGFATGATIHETTDWPVVLSFTCSNLLRIATAMRKRFPDRDLIIAADNDTKTVGNPGVRDGTKAARSVGARFAFPPGHADFNDISLSRGADAIRPILDAALVPPKQPILSRGAPLKSAKVLLARHFNEDGHATMHFHRGEYYGFTGSHFAAFEHGKIRSRVYDFLDDALYRKGQKNLPFEPNAARVSQVLDALQAASFLDERYAAPCFLDGRLQRDPASVIACQNGLLEINTRTLQPHTPAFFNNNAVPFDYDEDAPKPVLWLRFLRELWGDDKIAIRCLQEIFGLLLTPATRLQKIFLVVGPRRSGKGTIGRVLTGLVGRDNVVGPTLAGLASQFGLGSLLDKRVAIVSDARLGSRTDQGVVAERLLSISGEDSITVDRKHRSHLTVQLPTRFVILTNELPRIADASGALASRYVVLMLEKNFLNKEDPYLTDKLLKELPGILNWALRGLERVRKRGHFRIPKSSADAIAALEDLGSPISAFVRERCEVRVAQRVSVARLFAEWVRWCESQGRKYPGTVQWFGKDLRAAVPEVKTRRDDRRFFEGIGIAPDFLRPEDADDDED